jgi:hypothetical protein
MDVADNLTKFVAKIRCRNLAILATVQSMVCHDKISLTGSGDQFSAPPNIRIAQ